MEGSAASVSPRPAGPRPGRGPRVLLLLVAVVCVLVGRGLGLLGGGDRQAEPARQPERPRFLDSAGGSPAASDNAHQPAADATAPEPVAPPTPNAELAVASPTAPVVAPPVEERPAAPGVDADRFSSLVSLVEARCEQGRFGAALAALEHVRTMPLDARQTNTIDTAQRVVGEALADALRLLAVAVRDGNVLGARTMAATLLAEGTPAVHARVAEVLHLEGREDLSREVLPGTQPWPIPRALARDRRVRTRLVDTVVAGPVIDSRSDEVTLRLANGQGVTFPTVPVVGCEPVDPTPAEAVEMGFVALHAKDALLARLWLACATLRGTPPLGDRAARLAELLR